MKSARWLPLTLFLVLAIAAAAIGAMATATGVNTWYPGLQKPAWNPPNWVFGPVWMILYGLMAVSTWRVWRTGNPRSARRTVSLYSAQLTLNALWSVLFFGLHRIGAALVDVVILFLVIGFIFARFWRSDRIAAAMWAPYVLWVGFAMALNAAIQRLN